MTTQPSPAATGRLQDMYTRLHGFGAATLHEAYARRGALPSAIKPIDSAMSFCGPAFTASCPPGDNLMLQVAISCAPSGSVIVLATGGYTEAGVFGDVLANACLAKGIAALVTDGGVRDARSLRSLGFPVFAGGLCIKGAAKQHIGLLNNPVAFGGLVVNPGDILMGDEDGVVSLPPDACDEVVRLAAARVELEQAKIAAYRAGKSVIEVNKLAPLLEQQGWSPPAFGTPSRGGPSR